MRLEDNSYANMSSGSDLAAAEMRNKIRNSADSLTPTGDGKRYYISNTGSDANNGNSPETAWATVDKLNSFGFAPGDVVLLERGGIYRGTFCVTGNVSYGAYGKGDKPAVYGCTQNGIDAVWEQDSDNQNIWICATNVHTDIGIVIFNHGVQVGQKRLENNLTSAYDFYHDTESGNLYLFFDGNNPSHYFGSIEFGERKHIVTVPNGAQNIVIDNICFKYGGSHGIGSGVWFKNLTVTNCEFGWIGGSIQHGTTRYGNAVESWGSCDGYTIENCYFYQIYDAAVTFQGDGERERSENIVFKNNLIEYCTYSFEYFQRNITSKIVNVTVEGNIMRFAGYGWGDQRPDKREASHIKSWNFANTCENFIIRGNILDTSRYNLYQIGSRETPPTMTGNTYIQDNNGIGGEWRGDATLMYDEDICGKIKAFDSEATVIVK